MSRSRAKASAVVSDDPQPYDGPIERIDGQRPYNRYLWPTRRFLAQHSEGLSHLPYWWGLSVVHLADGRWATGGHVSEIEDDRTHHGERCCYATYSEAIRAVAARLIVSARREMGTPDYFGSVKFSRVDGFAVIAWALDVVAAEADRSGVVGPLAASKLADAIEARAAAAEAARLARLPAQSDLFDAAA